MYPHDSIPMIHDAFYGAPPMSAKHFDEGKPDLTQLPWPALKRVAEVMMMGEKKYGKWNFMGGMDWTKLVGSTLRHCYKWLDGEDDDDESHLSHLGHAAADLLMLIAIIEAKRGTDDRYKRPDPRDEMLDETVKLIKAVCGESHIKEMMSTIIDAHETNYKEELRNGSNATTQPAGTSARVLGCEPGEQGSV